MKLAVIGGDRRSGILAGILAARGYDVAAFALDEARREAGVRYVPDAGGALEGAGALILPLPATNGRGAVTAPLARNPVLLEDLLPLLPRDACVLAGRILPDLAAAGAAEGRRMHDYFLREEVTVTNAALTAEGAVSWLLDRTEGSLLGMETLVVGFGRIGKLTALRLAAMGARVTVSARKRGDLAWIRAMGFSPAETGRLAGTLGRYAAVVNTVPAPVLPASLLAELRPGSAVLDLASAPGGADLAAARRLGLRAETAPGLPGKTAPAAAAAVLAGAVISILEEEEPQ